MQQIISKIPMFLWKKYKNTIKIWVIEFYQ